MTMIDCFLPFCLKYDPLSRLREIQFNLVQKDIIHLLLLLFCVMQSTGEKFETFRVLVRPLLRADFEIRNHR